MRRFGLLVWLLFLMADSNGMAQDTSPHAKEIVFDTVSITPFPRTGLPDSYGADPRHTPDGYDSLEQPIWGLIMLAYYDSVRTPLGWHETMLQGAPAWVIKNEYVIHARVAPEDIALWQQPDPGNERLRHALQVMLKERCHLAVHSTSTKRTVLALVVKDPAKVRSKLTRAGLPVNAPEGFAHPPNDGYFDLVGVGPTVQYYGMSMRFVANYMSGITRTLIVDRTNLPGGYDFVLPAITHDPDESHDIYPFPWDLDSLGLALKPVTAPVETLVVDHIDPPSAN